ncbi:hypothetical protein BCR42DRAFT_435497 [Absidia repens]|uniref:SH3 domain-containing protein n=1 Tax=Absidia repens TaxID=90262 RepID=A0A1X2INR8_9FUNG|nr:hypothetical protein BCR42DRAFT_435497 [Absidia repens]
MTDTVTAHHDYKAQQDDELSFIAGDIIKVTDHSNADWWLGSKQDGSSGYFPSNFVEAASQVKETSTAETGTVAETTTATSISGSDKEAATTTTADVDKDAAAATPSTSIDDDTTAGAASGSEQAENPQVETEQQRPSIGMARVMEDYAMQHEDELTLHKGGIVVLYERSDDGEWLNGEINGKQGRFPAKYVEDIDMPGRPDLGISNTDMTSQSGDAGAKAPPGGFKLAAFGVKQGGIGSLLAGGIPTLKKTSVKTPTPTTTEPRSEPQSTTPTDSPSAKQHQQHPEQTTGASLGKAIVLHPYDAENDDELNLIRGEYVDILDRHADDGWWQGRNEKNQSGVFPSNFVKEIEQDQQAAIPPPVRTRKSVASVGATQTLSSSPVVPSESRPFSTPTPSLQQRQPTPVVSQRLPPLPDSRPPVATNEEDSTATSTVQVKEDDSDSFGLKETPVGDSASNDNQPTTPEVSPRVETSPPAMNIASVDQQQEEAPSPKEHAQNEQQQVPVETKSATEQPQSPVSNVDQTASFTAHADTDADTVTGPEVQEQSKLDKEEDDITTKQEEIKDNTTTTAAEEPEFNDSTEENQESKDSVTTPSPAASLAKPAESKAVEETPKADGEAAPASPNDDMIEQEPKNGGDVDEDDDESKKGTDVGLPQLTTGPRLVSPSRTSRPSNRAGSRRPPTKPEASPSQTELLQQELEKTPEEESPSAAAADTAADTASSPTSPPPKPIKPIFAKFPTPFAMGGGEGISAKNLKPVQRRMFEPSPAYEPSPSSSPPTATQNDEEAAAATRPTPGGVRGLASRFAGMPSSGGGNEVMETKLKNFTKNEVEKTRKEFEKLLDVERARTSKLEAMVESLLLQIDQLNQQVNGDNAS